MKVWGASHVGKIRQINEDAYVIQSILQSKFVLMAVCDGMGGAKAGEVASQLAVSVLSRWMSEKLEQEIKEQDTTELLREGVEKANMAVYLRSCENHDYEGMGTTMTAALISEDQVVIANVGDSRAYWLSGQQLSQVTEDHSLVCEMMRRGDISPEEAQHHPSRNIITRVLGVEKKVNCDIFVQARPEEGWLLLCSDGLSAQVEVEEICRILLSAEQPEKACRKLIEMANTRGGHDNVTVVVAAL